MNYSGKNKIAAELQKGDFVTTTGYSNDAAEIESVKPVGNRVIVTTCTGQSANWLSDKVVRLYL